jgi:hypothetical protein
LSPAGMTRVWRQFDTQIETIQQRLQQVQAAAGAVGARATVDPGREPGAGRRTGTARGGRSMRGGGGAIPGRRGARGAPAGGARGMRAGGGGIPARRAGGGIAGRRGSRAGGGIPGRRG